MRRPLPLLLTLLLVAAAAGALGWGVLRRLEEAETASNAAPASRAAPVEVAPVERGPIALRRTFSGALEATAEFVLAPKVGGRVEELRVDLADPVQRGDVVVVLEDDEWVQEVRRAEAELEVTRAGVTEAESELQIAQRSLDRIQLLSERGVSSEAQLDSARAAQLSADARVAVARAREARAEAELETARIRLAYTRVRADWTGGDDERIVSMRYVDEGETVAEGQSLLGIVELDPLTGVFFVPERDYSRLRSGQAVSVATRAWPGETFTGEVARIAPVFRASTRQARVEVRLANEEHRLKPGMFVSVSVELERVEDATLVPQSALTERDDGEGVFLLAEDGASVRWCPVEVGIVEGGRAEVRGQDLRGEVVVLGQQLVEDGSAVVVPDREFPAGEGAAGDGTAEETPAP